MSGVYEVRENLKTEIRRRGLTIADAARAAELSYACLSSVLNGRARPSSRVIEAMAKALRESPEVLFPDSAGDDGSASTHLKPTPRAATWKR